MSENSLTLSGCYVDLELLNSQHNRDLCEVVSSDSLCYHPQTFIPSPELMAIYITLALRAEKKGEEIPFAIYDKRSQKVVGSIKLENLHNLQAEVGSTFISLKYQKRGLNSEAKLIIMKHAFEVLGLHQLSFIIHKDNLASQKAIESLGIKQNSCFSQLKTMPEWKNNEFINYSIAKHEWQKVKQNLKDKLFH